MPVIEGTIERITFHNEGSGFTVARLKEDSGRIHTVVGEVPQVAVGETMRVSGEWETHPDYGPQLKVSSFERLAPASLAGIEKYLGSGLIKGIGPQTAHRIVKTFGLAALEIIQNRPERLLEVEGIGDKKAESICRAVAEQREIQDVMVFLQGHGVSQGYAARIYKQYGRKAVQVVSENPYRLADDVFGIGFKTADKIARATGIPNDSLERVIAGVEYQLSEMSAEGHVYACEDEFVAAAAAMLEVPGEIVLRAIPALEEKRSVFRVSGAEGRLIYLAPFYYAECGVAERLLRLARPLILPGAADPETLLEEVQKASRLRLASEQVEAVSTALRFGVTVITGGPGTGKTTTLRVLLDLLNTARQRVVMAAPTGRAAKRMAEATGHEAKTLHRLLEFSYESGSFRYGRNEERPLDADVIVVDEVSMVDLLLMYNLLKAVPPGARLVLVGDADQLPAVGAGNVLRDVIASGAVPVVRLKIVFRQGEQSYIALNAQRIKDGTLPITSKEAPDFFFVEEPDPEKAVQTIIDLVARRLPRFLHCDPIEHIQVLTPMRRTITGVENLNPLLQNALNGNPSGHEVLFAGTAFRAGDKVMQIRNNYQRMVFNGDVGRIVAIDAEEREIRVLFPDPVQDRTVAYDFAELDELVLSFAVSVHKSQGSEYPVVVMPVTTQHYVMLQRNLLYTAITRAKRMVVLVGTKKALGIAVRNNRIEERRSLLAGRLAGNVDAGLPPGVR